MYYDEERERYLLDVPTECPTDGSELELDVCDDATYLRCPICDYELDVTKEFADVSEANGEDEDDEDEDQEDQEENK